MANILLIEPNGTSKSTIKALFKGNNIITCGDAEIAVQSAADNIPDLVVIELTLKNHSGMEFLYEFRTYADWVDIPIIVYSSIRISSEVLNARSWKTLNIYDYLYKPDTTLAGLKSAAMKALS